jgi:hypothetical protein
VRALIIAILVMVTFVILVRSVPAPFPSPSSVLDKSYGAIVAEVGAPADIDPNARWPAAQRLGKSVVWLRPWPLAVWKLQIDYGFTPFGQGARPDGVSRCLESKWTWVNWVLPCEAVFRARIWVS